MWYPPRERTRKLDDELSRLEEASDACDGELENFLVRISACVRHLAANEILPPFYLRDWIWIANQFRINFSHDNRARALARRALLYLKRRLNSGSDDESAFRQDLNWVTEKTVAEIRACLGPNDFSSFLDGDELARVEQMFADFRSQPEALSADDESRLSAYLEQFADVTSETYLPGIAEMVHRLLDVARSDGPDRPTATAALRYLLEQEDVVPDSLGYVGLVDDIHVIERVYEEIENRSTWSPVLERFAFEWPYLEQVAFDEGDAKTRFSPYMKTVFGTALLGLRSEGTKTCLVLPETGVCGLIGAFLAAVESIRTQTNGAKSAEQSLKLGDHIVFGDANVMVRAVYARTIEDYGQTFHMVALRGGGEASVSWPVIQMARKAGQPHSRLSSAKEFEEWRKTHGPSVLTHLVGREFRFSGLKPQVLFLTRRNRLDDNVSQVRPMGRTIPELVGLKYVTATAREDVRSGTNLADPLIWCCSDPATARDLIVSGGEDFEARYVVVDDSKLAVDFEEILRPDDLPPSSSRVLFCGLHETETVQRLLELDNRHECWFLRKSDVDLVPAATVPSLASRTGPVSLYQRRQATQAIVNTEIHEIECEPVEFLYEHLRVLRQKIRETYEPSLQIVAIAAGGFIRRFIGSPIEFDKIEEQELRGLLQNLLQHCGVLADYDSDIRGLSEHVQTMLASDLPPNPHQKAIERLIEFSNDGRIAVLCQSAQIAASTETRVREHPVLSRASWLSIQQLRREPPLARLIVPGWLGRLIMREIRNNGYARHVDLILYDFEREWERSSRKAGISWERRLTVRMKRQWPSIETKLGKIAPPAVLRDMRAEVPEPEKDIVGLQDDEILEEQLIETIRRRTAGNQTARTTAKGRLVTFEEAGTFIYLPPQGHVISLSWVIEAFENEKDDARSRDAENLVRCLVSEITRGDLLAFPLHSTSDLLDLLGDHFIDDPSEKRRLADLWRVALQDYHSRTGKSVQALQRELAGAGLRRHPLTVRLWLSGTDIVAPMSYSDAIDSIAGVTGHKELVERIEDVKSAIDLIYRARGRAAGELLRQFAGRNVELREGMASVTIEGQEIQYRLHRVVTVDAPTEVAVEEIGVLRNLADFLPAFAPKDPGQ